MTDGILTIKELSDYLKVSEKTIYRINVSEICRIALQQKVIVYEQIQATLSNKDTMTGLVERLKVQKADSTNWSYDAGGEDGKAWAIHDARFQDFVDVVGLWNEVMHLNYGYQEFPFPFDIESVKERYDGSVEAASRCGEAFIHDAYAMGFRDAVCEVWEKVKNQI